MWALLARTPFTLTDVAFDIFQPAWPNHCCNLGAVFDTPKCPLDGQLWRLDSASLLNSVGKTICNLGDSPFLGIHCRINMPLFTTDLSHWLRRHRNSGSAGLSCSFGFLVFAYFQLMSCLMVGSLCCGSRRSNVGDARVVMATIGVGSVWIQDCCIPRGINGRFLAVTELAYS